MCDAVLGWYRRSILFSIRFENDDSTDLFMDFAPQYARIHGLDPIPFIHWRLKSVEMFGRVDIVINTVRMIEDLITIFRALNSTALREPLRYLSVALSTGIGSAIAPLIPRSIRDLKFILRDNGILEPSTIPACIRSLPKLHYLDVDVTLSEHDYQPCSRFTVAECYFPSLPIVGILEEMRFQLIRNRDPFWDVYGRYTEGTSDRNIETLDRMDGVLDFEREVRDWFQLSTPLYVLHIFSVVIHA